MTNGNDGFRYLQEMNDDPKATGQDLVDYIQYSLGVGHVGFMVLRSPGSVVHQNNYGFSTYPMNGWASM